MNTLKINKKELLNNLKIVGGLINKKPKLDILKNVKFEINYNILNISVNNVDAIINIKMNIESNCQKELIIHCKQLIEYIRLIDNNIIEISIKENNILLNNKYNVQINDLKEYPNNPILNNNIKANINNFDIDILNKVYKFTSTDTTKPVLNGVYFELLQNDLDLVSTDGYRLAKQTFKLSNNNKLTKAIINNNIINFLLKHFSKNKTNIVFFEDHIEFNINDNIYIITQSIPGDYLDINYLFDQWTDKHATKLILNTSEILDKLKIIQSIFKINKVKYEDQLIFVNSELIENKNYLLFYNKEYNINEKLLIDNNIKFNLALINLNLLIEPLTVLKVEKFTLKYSNNNYTLPLVIEVNDFIYMFMKVKIKN